MRQQQTFSIGQLAAAAGVNIETVRYYTRRGLIEQPTKPKHGYRVYPRPTLKRILFIKRAQELGFTLAEIANLLALEGTPCREVQEMARQKLVGVSAKIADLSRLASVLDELIARCESNQDQTHCPIIDSLLPADENMP